MSATVKAKAKQQREAQLNAQPAKKRISKTPTAPVPPSESAPEGDMPEASHSASLDVQTTITEQEALTEPAAFNELEQPDSPMADSTERLPDAALIPPCAPRVSDGSALLPLVPSTPAVPPTSPPKVANDAAAKAEKKAKREADEAKRQQELAELKAKRKADRQAEREAKKAEKPERPDLGEVYNRAAAEVSRLRKASNQAAAALRAEREKTETLEIKAVNEAIRDLRAQLDRAVVEKAALVEKTARATPEYQELAKQARELRLAWDTARAAKQAAYIAATAHREGVRDLVSQHADEAVAIEAASVEAAAV